LVRSTACRSPLSARPWFACTQSPCFGIAALSWQIRHSQDGDIQKPVLLAFFITDFGGFLVMLFAQLRGLMNALGWSVVGLLLLLSAAYAYRRFAK